MSFYCSVSNSCSHLVKFFSLFVSAHVTRGLCKVLGYEGVEHGTTFSNYVSILRSGADPSRGGDVTQFIASHNTAQNARNFFYVFRDSKITLASVIDPRGPKNRKEEVGIFLLKSITRRGHQIYHAYCAYTAEYKKQHPDHQIPRWMDISNIIRAIFTPRIRFIYSLEEIYGNQEKEGVFEEDKDYAMGLAYRTRLHLPSERIGLIGLLRHAEAKHVVQHIRENPNRVIIGIGQVALGVFLTYKGLGIFL